MTVPETNPTFSAPPQTITCDGMLFDMDGTIIDSTDAIEKHWHMLGKQMGVDPEVILETSHGRRSIDVLKLYDASLANWEFICKMEGEIPWKWGSDAIEIPGARVFLDELEAKSIPWCIVTSGTRPLVTGWLDVMKLAHPKNLVTAEDVDNGKPDPTCYLMGRKKLELASKEQESSSIVVFEDAPAGIRAGKAAGFTVVALHTTHRLEQLKEAGADVIVQDMRSVGLKSWSEGEAVLEIRDALVG